MDRLCKGAGDSNLTWIWLTAVSTELPGRCSLCSACSRKDIKREHQLAQDKCRFSWCWDFIYDISTHGHWNWSSHLRCLTGQSTTWIFQDGPARVAAVWSSAFAGGPAALPAVRFDFIFLGFSPCWEKQLLSF